MIALHISFHNGIAYLWGEKGQEEPCTEVTSGESVRDFPYDPGAKGLRQALRQLNLPIKISAAGCMRGLAWLPARKGIPEPSSPLLGTSPDARRKLILTPFAATLRPLSTEKFLELCALDGSLPSGAGVILGPSFSWGNKLLALALSFVTQEAFLPGLVPFGENWQARWLPLPDETLESRMMDLAAAMPGSFRCLTESADSPPQTSPAGLTAHLLATCVDWLIRSISGSSAQEPLRTRGRKGFASLHEAWLAALIADDATVDWTEQKDLREFAAQLETWQRPVDLLARAPYRFCLRLSEPAEDEDGSDSWQVDYLLQAKSDPSLQVAVGDLWNLRSKASRQFAKIGGNPTEFILTSLGQASGLCPPVTRSLRQKAPSGFVLNTQEAYDFLSAQAEALRSAGFSVMLPAWWVGRGPQRRLALKARAASAKMTGSGGLSLDAMVDFDLCACLGEEELSLRELRELARLKAPLVQVRGQWTQIDQDQLQTALRFLEKRSHQSLSARELLGLALGKEERIGGLEVQEVETEGWLQELLQKLTGQIEFSLVDVPKQFVGELRPYQQRGLSWLAFLRQWGLGACLADDMGLGKTVQTLALVQREREAGEQRPVLLICPTTVVNNWRREAQKFTPELPVAVHHGPDRPRGKSDFTRAAGGAALMVSSYGLLHRDSELFRSVNWSGMILDEAQNIKNPQTKQFKAARALHADYRIALTGTPVENHVGDLWALMEFLNPGFLGSQGAFRQNFYRPIQIWQDAERAQQLKGLTGPFMLRRVKTDRSIIRDLPEKIESREFCTLSCEQASLYQAVVDDLQSRLEQVEGIQRRGLVLATLAKLKQVCNHPAHFLGDGSALAGRSGKLARLEGILEEILDCGERTLIFTQFAEMGTLLRQHLRERFARDVFFLHGATPRKKRDAMIADFQNDPQAPAVFILSLKAGGTGLTLTRANHVVHFDRWWNPAVEDQATDRAFRIGQTRNVQVHKLLVAGTLEERIDEMIRRKSAIAAEVVGTGEAWLSELSNAELSNLLRLGAEAIGEER